MNKYAYQHEYQKPLALAEGCWIESDAKFSDLIVC
jgi:hypothetical protein